MAPAARFSGLPLSLSLFADHRLLENDLRDDLLIVTSSFVKLDDKHSIMIFFSHSNLFRIIFQLGFFCLRTSISLSPS